MDFWRVKIRPRWINHLYTKAVRPLQPIAIITSGCWLISPRVNCPSPTPINFNCHSCIYEPRERSPTTARYEQTISNAIILIVHRIYHQISDGIFFIESAGRTRVRRNFRIDVCVFLVLFNLYILCCFASWWIIRLTFLSLSIKTIINNEISECSLNSPLSTADFNPFEIIAFQSIMETHFYCQKMGGQIYLSTFSPL